MNKKQAVNLERKLARFEDALRDICACEVEAGRARLKFQEGKILWAWNDTGDTVVLRVGGVDGDGARKWSSVLLLNVDFLERDSPREAAEFWSWSVEDHKRMALNGSAT